MMNTILITGASGFVGSHLSRSLLAAGHRVVGTGTRASHPLEGEDPGFEWVSADTTQAGPWQARAEQADVIINLAGQTIFKPWTRSYKEAIYRSRILTTRNLLAALPQGWGGHLISASAAGYYGDRKETVLSETADKGRDFLAHVCGDWEAEAQGVKEKGGQVSILRLGVVLGQGGALSVMKRPFRFFMGGPLGSGDQWFPWIHIQDLERSAAFIMAHKAGGIFNVTGPEPVRQKDFARALGRVLNRPAIMPAPAVMVRLIMGELGTSLLQSQRAVPTALTALGFQFDHKTVDQALEAIWPGH